MIGFLWNHILRDTFLKLNCKHCKYKSVFAVAMLWHLFQKHKVKATKKDLRFLLRNNLLTRLLMSVVALPLFIICLVLKGVLLPFYYIYEIL